MVYSQEWTGEGTASKLMWLLEKHVLCNYKLRVSVSGWTLAGCCPPFPVGC